MKGLKNNFRLHKGSKSIKNAPNWHETYFWKVLFHVSVAHLKDFVSEQNICDAQIQIQKFLLPQSVRFL